MNAGTAAAALLALPGPGMGVLGPTVYLRGLPPFFFATGGGASSSSSSSGESRSTGMSSRSSEASGREGSARTSSFAGAVAAWRVVVISAKSEQDLG